MEDRNRMEVFLNSLEPPYPEPLIRLEADARARRIPIIRRPTMSLLRYLVLTRKPVEILEVGTAIGFSALFMNTYQPGSGTVYSIEKMEERYREAQQHVAEAGRQDRIFLEHGDAAESLERLITENRAFDFAFMDAAKGQYPAFLPAMEALLKPGGLLVTDNVLQEESLLESKYIIERRDRTIHERMRSYLYTLKHSSAWETLILPEGDGVALSVRTEVRRIPGGSMGEDR